MPWFESVCSTVALSATEPTTWVSPPGTTSRPIATWPAARRRGARNWPSHPDEPVSRTRITNPFEAVPSRPQDLFLREPDRGRGRRGATAWPDPPTPASRARSEENGSRDLHSGRFQGTHPV